MLWTIQEFKLFPIFVLLFLNSWIIAWHFLLTFAFFNCWSFSKILYTSIFFLVVWRELVLNNLEHWLLLQANQNTKQTNAKSNFNFVAWNWETITTHFTPDVTKKSCVLKMVDARAYSTLSHRQIDNKWANVRVTFLKSK